MPVGLIWGTADRVVPYSGLEALRRLRPDALVETLPATGHIPQVERPAAFVAALERILDALGLTRTRRYSAAAPDLPARAPAALLASSAVRRLLVLACAIVFVDTTFYAAITPLLPHFEDEFGLSKSAAGVLVAAYPAGTLVGAIPGGYLAARAGVRATVLLGPRR